MKKYIVLITVLFVLVGCSQANLQTIDEVYTSNQPTQQEKMSSVVSVYTVSGTGQGRIVAETAKKKWIEVDAALVSQHPISLVETSIHKQYEATIESVHGELAYIVIKSSVPVDETSHFKELENIQDTLTLQERLTLKARFADTAINTPDEILQYEDPIFTQNPDEVEQFIIDFENNERPTKMIANDALVKLVKQLKQSSVTYELEDVTDVVIGKTMYVVKGEIVVKEKGEQKNGVVTYIVMRLQDELKLINIEMDV